MAYRVTNPSLILALAGLVAGPASAADGASYRNQMFNGIQPVAGFETEAALSRDWNGVGLYAVADSSVRMPAGYRWFEFVARRDHHSAGGANEVTWTSSTDCPALRNVVVWATELSAPRIEVPGMSFTGPSTDARRPRRVVADGLSVSIWGRGTQSDDTAGTFVEMRSNGGAIAEFGAAALEGLRSCWRSEQPRTGAR